jgi:ribonucleoside-diphosphate reductase alpha chain
MIKIKKLNKKMDVYDIQVPTTNSFYANNILVHNCEIVQYTDSDRIAICSLSSIPLQKCVLSNEDGSLYFSHDLLFKRVRLVTRSLNKVIDINKYSTEEGRKAALEQRAIGIGVQGLADTFALLKYDFISDESILLNKEISETIYFASLFASNELAKEQGLTYDFYEGSPISQGVFQFNMWGVSEDDLSGRWNWKELREKIKTNGVRNSMLVAYMPTASSASIIGSNEAFEPFNDNIYVRQVIGGEFAVINKYMVKDLEEEGLWNDYLAKEIVSKNGDISLIPVISDEIKNRYKTAYQLPQSKLIEMSRDRGLFTCQSQSLNIFMTNPTVGKLTSSHFKAWELGLKTGMYYLRSKPIEFKGKHLSIDTQTSKEESTSSTSDFNCDGCSA